MQCCSVSVILSAVPSVAQQNGGRHVQSFMILMRLFFFPARSPRLPLLHTYIPLVPCPLSVPSRHLIYAADATRSGLLAYKLAEKKDAKKDSEKKKDSKEKKDSKKKKEAKQDDKVLPHSTPRMHVQQVPEHAM